MKTTCFLNNVKFAVPIQSLLTELERNQDASLPRLKYSQLLVRKT